MQREKEEKEEREVRGKEEREVQVWIDADGCPRAVKEILFRAAMKREVVTWVVANRLLSLPFSPYLRSVCVRQGEDVADDYIVQHLSADDVVVTEDVPLAAQAVERGAIALSPHGRVFTEENIGERLSLRNFMHDLREEGVVTGGPSSFGAGDRHRFAAAFDRVLTEKLNALKQGE